MIESYKYSLALHQEVGSTLTCYSKEFAVRACKDMLVNSSSVACPGANGIPGLVEMRWKLCLSSRDGNDQGKADFLMKYSEIMSRHRDEGKV